MSHKINGLPNAQTNRLSQQNRTNSSERGETERSESVAAGGAEDRLELTGTSQKLAELSKDVAAQPAVNGAKVESVRAQLRDGSYQVDANKLADRLVALERQMGGKKA